MKKLWQAKEKAKELRKKGWTYPEIQHKIGVHKNTLTKWCRDIQLSPKQIKYRGGRYANRLKGARANYLKRQEEIADIQKKAALEIKTLSPYELKIAGAALYWGEGDKTHGLAFSNSDPRLIKFMMKWLRECCSVSNKKLRAYLYLHTGQSEKKMQQFWCKITKIPLEQFNKTIFKPENIANHKHPNSEYKGTIKIQIFDENLKHRVFTWIEQLKIYAEKQKL